MFYDKREIMRITGQRLRYIAMLAALLLTVGCDRPREIPDDDLVAIFHDAYLTNAYFGEKNITNPDSLYVYEPIFERYGYTVEDVQHSIKTFAERKSAMLSDMVSLVYKRLEAESREEARRVIILDSLDHIAQRAYRRTIYADSLIRASSLADSAKLRITIDGIIPGEYHVRFDYFIDSLDDNYNSRIEVYALRSDSSQSLRHTTMMSRHREANYSRRFTLDSSHRQLYINMFYHPRYDKPARPDITIRNLEVIRILPAEVSVDSLYQEQLNIRIFNHATMQAFTADTLRHEPENTITTDSLTSHEPQDSISLRTN